MLRIAFATNYIVKNGPGNVILNIIENLNKSQYEIALITLFEENDPEVVTALRNNGVSVYECTTLNRRGCLLGKDKEFVDIVRAGDFDILHTHGLISDVLSARINIRAKKISTIHNNMYEDYRDGYGYFKSRILIAVHMVALKKLNCCVCCSKSVWQVMKTKLRNTTYIRNGIRLVNARHIIKRKEFDIPENARVFLYAGVLTERKNVVTLIEKFVRYHKENEYLLLIGEGEKSSECHRKSDKEKNVKMIGFQTDVAAYMNISDIYISASKSEGFSISVLEALSCGLGLFLSDIPSHREIIEMGKEVYLGKVFSLNDFEEGMEDLRKVSFARKDIMSFQEKYLSATKMAGDYMRIYTKICED